MVHIKKKKILKKKERIVTGFKEKMGKDLPGKRQGPTRAAVTKGGTGREYLQRDECQAVNKQGDCLRRGGNHQPIIWTLHQVKREDVVLV